MRKRVVIIVSVFVCLGLIFAFVFLSWRFSGLWYEGRHLSKWLPLMQSSSQQEREHAEKAIREIGVNALPFLEEVVENARFRTSFLQDLKLRLGFDSHDSSELEEYRRMVFNGYGALGDIAKPSVPFLVEKLKDTNPSVRSTAAGALGWIGPCASEAVPGLMALLKDNKGYVRRDAASVLGRICAGSNDAAVIDALGDALNDKDSQVQEYAKRALESVQKNADVAEEVK